MMDNTVRLYSSVQVRKKQDLYLWLAKSPDGPSVKFHVANVHTMAEVRAAAAHA